MADLGSTSDVSNGTIGVAVARSSAPVQLVHQIRTVLDQDNFLLWKSQVLPVLRGHNLDGFLDDSRQAPARFSIDANGAQLQTLKKGSSSCNQFLQQLQSLADRLRSIGSAVTDHDLVVYASHGLGSDYDAFVTAITMREVPPIIREFSNLLLAHEARILTNLRNSSSSAVHITTASTGQSQPSTHQEAFFAGRGRGNRGRGQYNRGRNGQRGRGRGCQNNSQQESTTDESNSKCQICQKWGHEALDCYHRIDIRYSAPVSSPSPQALVVEPAQPVNNQGAWYIDSGATTHVTSDINNLSSSMPYNGSEAVHIGNGSGLTISHKGYSIISIGDITLKLNNLLCVPAITKNLLSVSQLTADNNVLVEFSSKSCFIKDYTTNKTLLHGTLCNGLYKLSPPSHHQALHVSQQTADIWHYRLAHCNFNVIDTLKKAQAIKIKSSDSVIACIGCNKAKAHKLPFVPFSSKTTQPLQLVHSDLWGPAPVLSSKGHRYYVHFTDDFTKFSWFYSCASKFDVSLLFAQFKSKVENLLSAKIKTFQCDGGTEFKPLMSRYPEISFQVSCPYTPQQNGVAERKHRHIVELGLASMFHAGLPLKYWDLIFESVVHVINRLLASDHHSFSPFEKLFSHKPDYSFFHVLGCTCFPLLRPYNTHKLEARSEECVFLGYSSLHKGYYCLHIPSDKIYVSRHVKFDETSFPFKSLPSPSNVVVDAEGINTTLTILPQSTVTATANAQPIGSPPTDTAVPPTPLPPPPNRSSQSTTTAPKHHMVTRSQTKTLKPRKFPHHQIHTASQVPYNVGEPTCYTQAVKSDVWRLAMATELSALAQNATWELVSPPPDAHIIGSKWIFKTKYKPDGSVERHKARLVAKGYNQEEGIDYEETFSPVIKPTTIRTVLSIALSLHWPCHQLDVNNAFLHGDLEETVYMSQPPGFADLNFPDHVCKLKKAIYGLKQAPRAWFSKLKQFLLSHNFISSQADNSLFILHKGATTIYLLVYVDDIIITGNDNVAIHTLMKSLDDQFSIKNLGQLNYFLGIEVIHHNSGMHLSQTRYLSKLLEKALMHTAKPCNTPMQAGNQLSKFSGTKLQDPQQYRQIVGALQYATITRPDLTFAVNKA
ncbi:hypothetical protein LUZ61_012267 [Rhynchospora tenuis]|uniref:Integrase catalytic domain-containing protein n=1 Tax=Rhynchospora tenuis TaxID=198213 RepID=A0AAD6A2L0_9POAL|nr:hypothetical protein LUZ61_012267 [Rhynchospora tenuis]